MDLVEKGLSFEQVKARYLEGVKKLLRGYDEYASKLGELEEAYPEFIEIIDEDPEHWKD